MLISQKPNWSPVTDGYKEAHYKYTNLIDARNNNRTDLRKAAIERENFESENVNPELAMDDKDVEHLYQNGLLAIIAPHNDYWDDYGSEMYHPVSEWQGPSGLSWINQ